MPHERNSPNLVPLAATLLVVLSTAPFAASVSAQDLGQSRLPPIDATGRDSGDFTVLQPVQPNPQPSFGNQPFSAQPLPAPPLVGAGTPVATEFSHPAWNAVPAPGSAFGPPPPEGVVLPDGSYLGQTGVLDGSELAIAVQPGHPIDHKPGSFFQKFTFTSTWVEAGGGPERFGVTSLETFSTFAVPFPRDDWPLLITPGFGVHFLQGPEISDAPPQVYDIYIDFTWLTQVTDGWTSIVGFTPGYFGDLENTTSDSIRFKGKSLLRYDWIPDRLQFVGGVLFLSRRDIYLLPVGGVIWTPNDEWRVEAVFPRPKLARRTRWDGLSEDWIYLAGEFGGDSWAIEREDGTDDNLIYRDLRLLLGWERNLTGGAHRRIEAGYVFARNVRYTSDTPDVDPPDTFLLRAGLSF